MSAPVFAIVGHPNKGKSSIVSTLSQDESVTISPIPGTTTENRHYPMAVDDEVLYELVDTPGFQRARAALEWMRNCSGTAVERADTVRRFVDKHQDDPVFTAECNLLAPILAGAGILYVVDGSRPFGEDYEAEMEILRWTGQPSLALINMIGNSDHSQDWNKALGQYFRIVRVFDAMTADFDRRVQLLLAFGEIREDWRSALEKAVRILREEQARRHALTARVIAEMLARMITHVRRRKLVTDEDMEKASATLFQAYKQDLVVMEQDCRDEVEQIHNHRNLERHEQRVPLLDDDLFSRQIWVLFGLTRQQLIATGALGGAAAGSMIDLAVHGASLLLGSGLGAVTGGISAWLTSDRIANIKVLGHSLGGKQISIGPMRNINFPYVVLGRALLHQRMIEQRTHAYRGPLKLAARPEQMQLANVATRRRFEKLFAKLRKQDIWRADLITSLANLIESVELQ
ncbi:probable integral membrane protein NMA1898 [hydrothermal vent metagenome]|uniref:Probable integral membrane protein NMA1898 n=1 Tax=hydrothermal vent metagenome TaxID=652676 RepID=A0A3B0YLY1_9ZZZZ